MRHRPRVLHGRLGQGRQPVRRARRQHRRGRRRQPGLETRRRAAAARPTPRCWRATTRSAWTRRSRTCASPTAPRVSCARPTASERVFRQAVIGLAKQHPFARSLVNTGRMAVANPYGRSRACSYATTSRGGQSVQNVGFRWADGSAGPRQRPAQLGRRRPAGAGVRRPAGRRRAAPAPTCACDAPVRSVQVLGANGAHRRWSMCATPKVICRAPARPLPRLGAGAPRRLPRRHRRSHQRPAGAGDRTIAWACAETTA